jgi:transposase InsO family protein
MDLGSRRVIGWALGNHHDTQLVLDALHAAMATRGRRNMGGRTIFHSDRGGELTAERFRRACRTFGLRQSAGRTGSCLDNAAAESLFASFKVEHVHRDGLYATVLTLAWPRPYGWSVTTIVEVIPRSNIELRSNTNSCSSISVHDRL